MKSKRLVIVGTGETARLATEYFEDDSSYDVIGYCADDTFKVRRDWMKGYWLKSIDEALGDENREEVNFFIGCGSARLNRDRMSLRERVASKGFTLASYISSRAFVSRNVEIGEGAFILEDNVIQSGSSIGSNSILWSGNHIGHCTSIGENVFISSHVVVAGFSSIGDQSFLGINSTIGDNVKIAKDNYIGAGCLITRDTSEGMVFKGNSSLPSRVGSARFCKY